MHPRCIRQPTPEGGVAARPCAVRLRRRMEVPPHARAASGCRRRREGPPSARAAPDLCLPRGGRCQAVDAGCGAPFVWGIRPPVGVTEEADATKKLSCVAGLCVMSSLLEELMQKEGAAVRGWLCAASGLLEGSIRQLGSRSAGRGVDLPVRELICCCGCSAEGRCLGCRWLVEYL